MKTTVEIADPLLREAKREAEQSGITLRELIELGLRRVLDDRKAAQAKPFKLRDGRGPGGYPPGVRPGDWRQMRAIMYGRLAGYSGETLEEIDRELEEEAKYEAENESQYRASLRAREPEKKK